MIRSRRGWILGKKLLSRRQQTYLKSAEKWLLFIHKRRVTPKLELPDKILPFFRVTGKGESQRICARQNYNTTMTMGRK